VIQKWFDAKLGLMQKWLETNMDVPSDGSIDVPLKPTVL
jgi:hypothetical protein